MLPKAHGKVRGRHERRAGNWMLRVLTWVLFLVQTANLLQLCLPLVLIRPTFLLMTLLQS